MGGIAPNVEEPTGGMAGADRERGSRKRKAIRACFEVLQNIVGPPTDKISYNKVLSDGMCPPSLWEVDRLILVRSQSWRVSRRGSVSHHEMVGNRTGCFGSETGECRWVGWLGGVVFAYDERRMRDWKVLGKRASPLICRIESIRMDPGIEWTTRF